MIHCPQDAVDQYLLRDVIELSRPYLLHEKAAFDTPGCFRANEDHPTFAKCRDPGSDIGHWPCGGVGPACPGGTLQFRRAHQSQARINTDVDGDGSESPLELCVQWRCPLHHL